MTARKKLDALIDETATRYFEGMTGFEREMTAIDTTLTGLMAVAKVVDRIDRRFDELTERFDSIDERLTELEASITARRHSMCWREGWASCARESGSSGKRIGRGERGSERRLLCRAVTSPLPECPAPSHRPLDRASGCAPSASAWCSSTALSSPPTRTAKPVR
jgi:hypothetical protein